jgi:oligopeptide/dipeptide ABC transporter ATP-binding protein
LTQTRADKSPILLKAQDLHCSYVVERTLWGMPRAMVRAVDGVSLEVARGETLAVVGESGCGKSTLGRALIGLVPPAAGRVMLDGQDLYALPRELRRRARRRLQIIFQDPYASLNPRMSAGEIIAEPLKLHAIVPRDRIAARVAALLDEVGLPGSAAGKYPFEFSGGQRQRLGIARALACEPDLIVCDEPVSALDVSVRAQVINLLNDLQARRGFAYVFISHDLSLVRKIAHRIAVMYLGRFIETGRTRDVFEAPAHPYTHALQSAVPRPEPGHGARRVVLAGDLPSPSNIPPGCRFNPRCAYRIVMCEQVDPALTEVAATHRAACHLSGSLCLPGADQELVRPSPALARRGAPFREAV